MKRDKVKITFTEEVLGTLPADPEIRKTYIESKAPADVDDEEDIDEPLDDKGFTIFPRQDGKPFVWDYQVKGLFKGACSFLRRVSDTRSSKMRAYKKIIDGNIFVFPRRIFFDTEGETGTCERPLRASTPQGDRVALASSETIPAGSSITVDIVCLNNLDMHAVEEWLDYGQVSGFGQWRNSGKGKFTYEILEEEKYDTKTMMSDLAKIADSWA